MSLTAKQKAGEFKEVPPGTHPAYCWGIVDIGYQESPYGTKEQVILAFELPTETVAFDGETKPMVMYSFYTLSLSPKANLRRDLEGWRGRAFTKDELEGFNIGAVLGKPCTLTVFHNENGRARIRSIGSAMKGVQIPPMHNPPMLFDLEAHGKGSAEYRALPEWIRNIIDKAVEPDDVAHRDEDVDTDSLIDDDIPFNQGLRAYG